MSGKFYSVDLVSSPPCPNLLSSITNLAGQPQWPRVQLHCHSDGYNQCFYLSMPLICLSSLSIRGSLLSRECVSSTFLFAFAICHYFHSGIISKYLFRYSSVGRLSWPGMGNDIVQQDSGKPNSTIAEGTSCYHGEQRCNQCTAERLLTPQVANSLRAI